MKFTSFTETILTNLKNRLGDEYTVLSRQVKKNNGVELTGIIAKRRNCNASPTIYIDGYYRENITQAETVEIADRIYRDLTDAQLEGNIDVSDFLDFEKAKNRIAYKLIHAEKNQKLLEEVPHKRFYNLAQVYYYDVQGVPISGRANILIHHSHVERWRVSQEEIFRVAEENTPRLFPGVIENIEEVMGQLITENYEDKEKAEALTRQMQEELEGNRLPMYVLSNRQKLNGAACMLYPGILKNFAADQGQDLYILPSSIHEVILVPANAGLGKEDLGEMVADINRTQVAAEEVLADSVYYYSKAQDKLLWMA